MSPQVLVLGMPRSGTQSIAGALHELGYGAVYHMREVLRNGDQDAWVALLHAKYGKEGEQKRKIGREELDEVLGDYDALADFPASIFVEELIAAYPAAKVILTTRDEEEWVTSMRKTIVHFYEGPENLSRSKGLADAYHRYCWQNDFEQYGRSFRREYAARVGQAVVGADGSDGQWLEFDVRQGWAPLCAFLGKPAPAAGTPFPTVDQWAGYKAAHANESS